MAVVTEFSAVPVGGLTPPSQAVQFTDESTGSPDSWLWSFGDGSYSDEQHPLHTYTGDGGDAFTVKLNSWIADTPLVISGTQTKTFKQTSAIVGEGAAFANYLALSWSTNTPSVVAYMAQKHGIGGTFVYLGNRVKNIINFSAMGSVDVAILVRATRLTTDATLNRTITRQASDFNINFNGSTKANGPDVGDVDNSRPVYDATSWAGVGGVEVFVTPEPESIIGAIDDDGQDGVIGSVEILLLKATAADNKDEEEKVDYIVFGTPPIAAFTAVPTSGPNPLSVQFENLSTPAIGLPTTYSWKKRKTGSGDAFVEFSTQEHPIEIFTK